MRRALALAANGWGRVAPNPLVGCVVVHDDGTTVGEGWHAEYGRPHAEVEALRAAGEAARGATAYVTLEPCAHWGKTPPCTRALQEAGVRRVVFAATDPNPRAAGGAETLRRAGLDVLGGIEAEAARDQNHVFFHAHSTVGEERPFVALKLALTLDARIADREGRSVWITGEAARAETHRLRAGYDAVAVGIGTVLADDPRLTVRGEVEPRAVPARVVFDNALRLPVGSGLARTAGETPVVVVTSREADRVRERVLTDAGVVVLRAADTEDGLRLLRETGIRSLFVEGGAGLAGALLTAGAVDRQYLFYAPLLLGPDGLNPFGIASARIAEAARWRHVRTETFGGDTLITLARGRA